MQIAKTNVVAKLSVAFVAAAMVLSFAAPAKAQTTEELQAMINNLLAQVASLQAQLGGETSGGSCSYVFTRDLGQGSTGQDVKDLQVFLNMDAETRVAASGAGSPGMETMYYGPATAAAVSKFQVKYRSEVLSPLGLVNPTGYFGAGSRAKANAICAEGVDTDGDGDTDGDTDGELEGGAGSIDSYQLMSALNNEEVGEDSEDVEVAGLEIEVSDSSDIEITAVKLDFDTVTIGSGDSDDFEDYAAEVSIWLDGEEVARVDADEFDDDNNFSRTITLDNGAIIRQGDTADLVVAVSGASTIDSGDVGNEWDVDFESVRFRDAQNVTISEDPGTANRTFSFESFATATDVEFKISEGDDEINDARTIEVSDTARTKGIELLSFNIEIEGDSDVELDALPVNFDMTDADGGAEFDDVEDVVTTAYLLLDGEVVGTETVVDDGDDNMDFTEVFDDLDLTLDAGETYEFTVEVDVDQVGAGELENGDTISAEVGETETDLSTFDAEDESGENLADADVTGSADGDAHTLRSEGIKVSFVSLSENKTTGDASASQDDSATYTFTFDVTSFGSDIWFDNDSTACTEDNDGSYATDAGVVYSISNDGSNTTTCNVQFGGKFSTATANETKKLAEGQTGQVTLSVTTTAVSADHYAAVTLEAINFAVTNDTTPEVFFETPSSVDDWESDPVYLQDNT